MRVYLTILILIFALQSLSKADDISDFEIEGLSVGETILKFMNSSEIDSRKVDYYKDNTYSSINIYPDEQIIKFEIYDQLVIGFRSDDTNYIISAISGVIEMEIDDCINRINEVTADLKEILPNTTPTEEYDEGTLGKHTFNHFDINGDNIKVSCVEYFETDKYPNHLRIAANKKEYQEWLNYKAYK